MNQEKTEAIIEAANKVFLRHGYQKTSMDDIAREALIGKGTIYYYFNTKEDIFITVLQKTHEKMKTNVERKIKKAKTFEDKFKTFLTEPFSYLATHRQLILQVLNEDSPIFLKKLNDFKAVIHDDFNGTLHEIFKFGVENNVFKSCYENSIERVIEIIFRWMFIGGEHVKFNCSEDSMKDIAKDFLLFSDILINGLINKNDVVNQKVDGI